MKIAKQKEKLNRIITDEIIANLPESEPQPSTSSNVSIIDSSIEDSESESENNVAKKVNSYDDHHYVSFPKYENANNVQMSQ